MHNRDLQKNRRRLLKHPLEGLKKSRALGTINHPMVTAHGDAHAWSNHDLAIDRYRGVLNPTDRENSSLGGVDDGRELMDPKHPKI